MKLINSLKIKPTRRCVKKYWSKLWALKSFYNFCQIRLVSIATLIYLSKKFLGSCLCNGTPLPSQGAFGFFIIFSLIFFLITVSLIFFLSLSFLSWFFTFQHSLSCFWLVSVVHSTSSVAFSFSYYFRVLRTGIVQGLGLFLRFWVCERTCFLFATLPSS